MTIQGRNLLKAGLLALEATTGYSQVELDKVQKIYETRIGEILTVIRKNKISKFFISYVNKQGETKRREFKTEKHFISTFKKMRSVWEYEILNFSGLKLL